MRLGRNDLWSSTYALKGPVYLTDSLKLSIFIHDQQHFFFFTKVLLFLSSECNFIALLAPPMVSGMSIEAWASLTRPYFAISTKDSSTWRLSLADVSKNMRSPLVLAQLWPFWNWTLLSDSKSVLLPITRKGKVFGSWGAACSMKPSFHFERLSNDFWLVMSYTRTQQSAPR